MREECDALSAQLLVVVIPDLHQVRRAARDLELDLLSRRIAGTPLDRWLDWNLPERRLAEFFRRQGIEAILLLPALREAVRGGGEVYLPDRHLSAQGHAIAAQSIARALGGSFASSPGAPNGRPVRLPVGERAPRSIQPGSPEQWLYRSQAWLPWKRAAQIEGALPLSGAVLAVPASGRDLLMRGIAAARSYPLEFQLEFVGGPERSLRIEKPGPFVLRLALPSGQPPLSDGHTVLRFHPIGEAVGEDSVGVIVRDVGFVPRS